MRQHIILQRIEQGLYLTGYALGSVYSAIRHGPEYVWALIRLWQAQRSYGRTCAEVASLERELYRQQRLEALGASWPNTN